MNTDPSNDKRPTVRPLITTDRPLCIDTEHFTNCSAIDTGSEIEFTSCSCFCICMCDYPCICPSDCPCPSPCSCPTGAIVATPTREISIGSSDDASGAFELGGSYRFREEETGALLFETKTLNTLVLNESAAWTLRTLVAGVPANLLEKVATSTLNYPRASADVREMIGNLRSIGALRVSDVKKPIQDPGALQPPRQSIDRPRPHLRAPNTVWWDVTNRCNLKCLHCYSASSPANDNKDELTTREAKTLITELADMGVFGIYFLGGEPLLRSDILALVAHARGLGLGVTISSNGWAINKSVAASLAALEVSQVRISIDGATAPVHDFQRQRFGSYQRAIQAVSCLRAAGIAHVGIVSTLAKHNVHQVGDIIDLAYDVGANAIQILVVAQSGRGDDNYDMLNVSGDQAVMLRKILRDKRTEYEGRMIVSSNDGLLRSKTSETITSGQVIPDYMGCQAARTCCNIDYNGNVIPCLLVRNPVAGNIREVPFADIWRHASVFEAWRRQGSTYAECSSCQLREACNRECPLSESQQVFTSNARMRNIKLQRRGQR